MNHLTTAPILFAGEPLSKARTGVAQYISQLAIELAKQGHPVAASLDGRDDQGVDNSDLRAAGVELRRPPKLAHDLYWSLDRLGAVPNYERIAGPARAVIFSNNRSFPTRAPQLATIHDLVHRLYPECIDAQWAKRVETRISAAIDRADVLLADTHAVAQELVDVYGVERSRLRIIPCAAPPLLLPSTGYVGTHDAILAVGTLERRKNLVRLIQAHQKLDPRLRRTHPLFIVGSPGFGANEVWAAAENDPFVKILSGVSRSDLAAMFVNAAMLAHVSFYEGFGIPAVEALSVGLPLLCADIPVLREVTANQADAYVDPFDVDAIAGGLLHVLTTTSGREPAKSAQLGYSWSSSAQLLAGVIGEVSR